MTAVALRPYMGWAGLDPAEGAVLVFAHHRQEAKRLAFAVLRGWFDCPYIDTRVRRLRRHADWVRHLANPAALAEGRPHAVDDPASCRHCNTWGTPLLETGECVDCAQAEGQG